MKVLNLQCVRQKHSFEGWFASEDDFQDQLARGVLECPLCGAREIHKLPSAPRLSLGIGREREATAPDAVPARPPASMTDMLAAAGPENQAAVLRALRELVARTEDVGERFAQEARRIHYGETDHRNIRGRASAREAIELLEEGIDVMSLPAAVKDTLQ
ncbi:MAG: DUF1178 family protein [Rhodoferax sp.]|nr:DUF1178 family protein [Rhodoferax sp.]